MTGAELRAIRDRWGESQTVFAGRLGRSANMLARYERDELTIPAIVSKLATWLDTVKFPQISP